MNARGAIASAGSLLQTLVQRDDVQQAQVLALVFVETLDLDVEQPAGIELDAGVRPDVVGQTALVRQFDRAPLATKRAIVDKRLELPQRLAGSPASRGQSSGRAARGAADSRARGSGAASRRWSCC